MWSSFTKWLGEGRGGDSFAECRMNEDNIASILRIFGDDPTIATSLPANPTHDEICEWVRQFLPASKVHCLQGWKLVKVLGVGNEGIVFGAVNGADPTLLAAVKVQIEKTQSTSSGDAHADLFQLEDAKQKVFAALELAPPLLGSCSFTRGHQTYHVSVMGRVQGTLHWWLYKHVFSQNITSADLELIAHDLINQIGGILLLLHRNRLSHGDMHPSNIGFVGDPHNRRTGVRLMLIDFRRSIVGLAVTPWDGIQALHLLSGPAGVSTYGKRDNFIPIFYKTASALWSYIAEWNPPITAYPVVNEFLRRIKSDFTAYYSLLSKWTPGQRSDDNGLYLHETQLRRNIFLDYYDILTIYDHRPPLPRPLASSDLRSPELTPAPVALSTQKSSSTSLFPKIYPILPTSSLMHARASSASQSGYHNPMKRASNAALIRPSKKPLVLEIDKSPTFSRAESSGFPATHVDEDNGQTSDGFVIVEEEEENDTTGKSGRFTIAPLLERLNEELESSEGERGGRFTIAPLLERLKREEALDKKIDNLVLLSSEYEKMGSK